MCLSCYLSYRMMIVLLFVLHNYVSCYLSYRYDDCPAICPTQLCVLLFVLQNADCPAHCSGHGNCVNGYCQCQPGYHGDDCRWTQTKSDISVMWGKWWTDSLFANSTSFWAVGLPSLPTGLMMSRCSISEPEHTQWSQPLQPLYFWQGLHSKHTVVLN